MKPLYDGAVDVCMVALKVAPHAERSEGLRNALLLLGTVIEGNSCIFSNRDRTTGVYDGFRARPSRHLFRSWNGVSRKQKRAAMDFLTFAARLTVP